MHRSFTRLEVFEQLFIIGHNEVNIVLVAWRWSKMGGKQTGELGKKAAEGGELAWRADQKTSIKDRAPGFR